MAINDITGDRLVNKVSKDSATYGENLEKIFGKRDFRNRPIPDNITNEKSNRENHDKAKDTLE